MRIMLVAPNEAIHERLTDRWSRDGHDVVSCTDAAGGPCRGVASPEACPLHAHVDLAVLVARSSAPSTLAEMGFVCAQRHRVATVTIDPVLAADELWHIESETSSAKHRLESDDASAVHERLPEATSVGVSRHPRRVAVEVLLSSSEPDAKDRLAIADRARQAIRAHDPYIDVIDVSVTCANSNRNNDNKESA